jgi:hypothetical protein
MAGHGIQFMNHWFIPAAENPKIYAWKYGFS